LAPRAIEKVPRDFVPGLPIGQHDIPHLVVPPEHADRALKE